jgi:hypothetical protein
MVQQTNNIVKFLNAALPIVQHLKKVVPTSITSAAHTDSVTLPWVICTILSPKIYYNGFKIAKDV